MYMCVGVGRLFHEDKPAMKGGMEGGWGYKEGLKGIAEERVCAEAQRQGCMHV